MRMKKTVFKFPVILRSFILVERYKKWGKSWHGKYNLFVERGMLAPGQYFIFPNFFFHVTEIIKENCGHFFPLASHWLWNYDETVKRATFYCFFSTQQGLTISLKFSKDTLPKKPNNLKKRVNCNPLTFTPLWWVVGGMERIRKILRSKETDLSTKESFGKIFKSVKRWRVNFSSYPSSLWCQGCSTNSKKNPFAFFRYC